MTDIVNRLEEGASEPDAPVEKSKWHPPRKGVVIRWIVLAIGVLLVILVLIISLSTRKLLERD